jgi:serine/threonine protein kinase/tetratricopeptide (TPR) repeat protein
MAPTDVTDPTSRNTPFPLDSDGSELLGSVVDGRYRLEATLGRGGMGLVFRATHIGLRRQVAVKILHPSLAASPDVRSRFEREALAVGKVDHPNCVATYDVGRLPDGSLYLAMELLEGRSLADVLEQEGQLAPGRALHILAHILRGLSGIHNAGLIHRDIKPENIFLIHQGNDMDFAKILDFGIAKPMAGELSDDGVRLTQAGMAFGTPIYMAPEQALGNKMDGRSDLYAAAVMGYEMLCGQPPFYSDDKLEVMSMHTAKAVPPMRSRMIRGGRPVPSSIERLIIKGLTKKPADRYANAEVFLAAVEDALHTPDGGVTDVNFERIGDETGARSLLDESGRVALEMPEDSARDIGDAIDEVLTQTPTSPVQPAKTQTPGRGVARPRAQSPTEDKRAPTKLGVEPPTVVDPPVIAAGAPLGRRAQGGVGIGIPYTGPSGEPIFGLTPEERLAQIPKKKRRWPLYIAILGGALGLGVAIALITAPSSGDDKKDEPKLDPTTPAGQASDALERGDPNAAIKILDNAKQLIERDPDAQLVLGHARAALHQSGAALAAYGKALNLMPTLAANPTLRANLRAMAADKDPDVVMNALDTWFGRTDDPGAKDALLKAVVSQSLDRRHAARPVIDRYKLADEVDWVTSYGLDLEQELTCEKRREAVAHLRALNNPKAIYPLERAVVKRQLRRNACLVDDAHSAIGFLKQLGAAPK